MAPVNLFRPFPKPDQERNLFAFESDTLPERYQASVHRHHFYEIAWLAKGNARFFSDFRYYQVTSGSLMFIRPGQVHYLEADWTQVSSSVIGFRPELFSLYGAQPKRLSELSFFAVDAYPVLELDTYSKPIFARALQSFKQRNRNLPQNEALLFSYLQVLLGEAEHFYSQTQKVNPSAATFLTGRFREALELHFLERKKVQDYAVMLNVSSNHLARAVRSVTGMSPSQMVQERLMLEAKRLLIHTSRDIADIAYELAFVSPSQFGAWFRNLEGDAPGVFRAQFSIE